MKKLNYLIALVLISIGAISCTEKDRTFSEYADIEHGAFARLLGKVGGTYSGDLNFLDPAGSNIKFEVEFYDDNNGKNVTNYGWDVSHQRAGKTRKTVKFGDFPSSSYVVNANGLPGLKVEIPMSAILAKLGYTIDSIQAADRFVFAGTITMADGKKFTQANSSAALELPAFGNFLRFSSNVVCPSDLTGEYDYKTVGWCGKELAGKLNLKEETKNGDYQLFLDSTVVDGKTVFSKQPDFSLGAYAACYPPPATLPGGTLKLSDLCNNLYYQGASRWGEVYTFNSITVDGANLILDWKNDYDPEAGVTTITRATGSWPALFK